MRIFSENHEKPKKGQKRAFFAKMGLFCQKGQKRPKKGLFDQKGQKRPKKGLFCQNSPNKAIKGFIVPKKGN